MGWGLDRKTRGAWQAQPSRINMNFRFRKKHCLTGIIWKVIEEPSPGAHTMHSYIHTHMHACTHKQHTHTLIKIERVKQDS